LLFSPSIQATGLTDTQQFHKVRASNSQLNSIGITQSMDNYSENWKHLESILTGYSTRNQNSVHYSYEDHTHAKALAIFLAHGKLATPKLDRTTVEVVLSGALRWPNTSESSEFECVDYPPLSLLEDHGLIAFYADWCTIYCQHLSNVENVDPSLFPLIRAIEHLRNIQYGYEGYVKPHFSCTKDKLNEKLAKQFGNATAEELIPELNFEDDQYKLKPGNQHFSSLISTYLWLELRVTLAPDEAFKSWILCFRVTRNT
jgi:hypothetical protein